MNYFLIKAPKELLNLLGLFGNKHILISQSKMTVDLYFKSSTIKYKLEFRHYKNLFDLNKLTKNWVGVYFPDNTYLEEVNTLRNETTFGIYAIPEDVIFV